MPFLNTLFEVISKIIDVVSKKSKNGEKEQEIEEKKVTIYSNLIIVVILTALFMCVIASFFPSLSITSWWFNFLERMLKEI